MSTVTEKIEKNFLIVSVISAAYRKQILRRIFKKNREVVFQSVCSWLFVRDSLNRGSSALCELSLYSHQIVEESVELSEDRQRRAVLCSASTTSSCKYWLQEFTTSIQLQGPLLIWNSLQLGGVSCVGLWTLTPVSQNFLQNAFASCALLYSCSWRLDWYRPCADFPLLSHQHQQFCNGIKGIPQFPKIDRSSRGLLPSRGKSK